MRSLMPRWMRRFPFADQIGVIYHLLLAIALIGLTDALMGLVAGLLLMLPFALFVFLLWRMRHDDGYEREL